MKHLASLLLCTALGLVAHSTPAQQHSTLQSLPPPASVLVITNVSVVDVVDGEILPNRMVVVQDGCITSIGTRAPAGRAVLRLDGRGKYVVPGLWDTHVQAPSTKARERQLLTRLVARGITSIYYFSSPAARPALAATQKAVEAGTQLGPRIVLAGSGSGWEAPSRSYSAELLTELTRLVASGCSPLEALQSATLLPAAAAGYRYALGQVAPDFRADLLLLDANPLENIRHLQQVQAVVLGGRVLDKATLQALLSELEEVPLPSAKTMVAR